MIKIKKFLQKNYYLLTALFLFLSFPGYDIFILKMFPLFAFFFLTPLLCFISGLRMKDLFRITFITGLLGHFFTYRWIGNFGAHVAGGDIVILSFLIPALSAFFTLKVFIAELLSRRMEPMRAVIYPSVWIIIDFTQSIGFLAFPWTYQGYSLYPLTPFIQIASVTGILGVNFLLIMFNASLADLLLMLKGRKYTGADLLRRRELRSFIAVFFMFAAVTVFGLLSLHSSPEGKGEKSLRVAAVQSCISPWENWTGNKYNYLAELIHHTSQSLVTDPEFIIWSESATLETISFRYQKGKPDPFDQKIFDFAARAGVPILTGEIGVLEQSYPTFSRYYPQNNAVLINSYGEVVQTYPKINLVPFGEWFPYEKWLPDIKKLAVSFGGSDFIPGGEPELFEVKGLRFGALICYEGIFFRLCRQYGLMGADFLVNITNDGWTDTYNGHYQHFAGSVFRAVENGIPVIRAGNTGVTAIIDSKGRITSSIPILKKGFMAGEVHISSNHSTFYSRHGDWILAAAVIFLSLICLYELKEKILLRRSIKG